jgi:hypothetical protein
MSPYIKAFEWGERGSTLTLFSTHKDLTALQFGKQLQFSVLVVGFQILSSVEEKWQGTEAGGFIATVGTNLNLSGAEASKKGT